MQEELLFTVAMLCKLGLAKNLEKTKSMVYMSGFIWGQLGKEAYNWQVKGEGSTIR